jgi:MscS family membrane protein
MKLKFESVFRTGLLVLALTLFWAVWANAQSAATDAAADGSGATNRVGQVLAGLEECHVTFGLDRVVFLEKNRFFGEPLWKYAASLIYILLAFYVSRLLDFVVNRWLKRVAARTETKFDDLLLELLHGPVKVVAFVIFLHIGLSIFHWPAVAERFLTKGLIVAVACSITYVAVKVVDLLLGWWRERSASAGDRLFNEQLFALIRKCSRIAIVSAAVLLTADNLGIRVTSVLAGLSIGGLALGLAAQDTVANLFGAVAIFLDRPFHIGDRIQLDTVDGTVESIGLRSTRLRSLDGHMVAIPNKTMGNAIITNVTRRPNIKTEMNIGLTYDTPAAKVKLAVAILEEILRAHPHTTDLMVSFNRFADSALNLQVLHWWNGTDVKLYLAGMQELNLAIKQRFDAEGISFAFPTRTLYVKQDSDGRVSPK